MLGAPRLVAGPSSGEQLRRDPQSFSPLPRERAVLQGEGLAKSAEIGRTLAHSGRLAEAAIEQGQSLGTLVFMATGHVTGPQRGEKSKKAKVLRRRPSPHLFTNCRHCAGPVRMSKAAGRRDLDAVFAPISK